MWPAQRGQEWNEVQLSVPVTPAATSNTGLHFVYTVHKERVSGALVILTVISWVNYNKKKSLESSNLKFFLIIRGLPGAGQFLATYDKALFLRCCYSVSDLHQEVALTTFSLPILIHAISSPHLKPVHIILWNRTDKGTVFNRFTLIKSILTPILILSK